jgi:hypothetical protein
LKKQHPILLIKYYHPKCFGCLSRCNEDICIYHGVHMISKSMPFLRHYNIYIHIYADCFYSHILPYLVWRQSNVLVFNTIRYSIIWLCVVINCCILSYLSFRCIFYFMTTNENWRNNTQYFYLNTTIQSVPGAYHDTRHHILNKKCQSV